LVEFVCTLDVYNIVAKACMTRHDGEELRMKSPQDRRLVAPEPPDLDAESADLESESLTLELEALNLELEALDLEPPVLEIANLDTDDPNTDDPDNDDCDNVDADPQPAGRIVHDEKGNARWKWRGETASTGTNTGTDSGILKYIDPADLSVEGDESPQPGGKAIAKPTGVSDAGGGYDPYNQGKPQSRAGSPGGTGPAIPGKTGRTKR